MSFLKSLIRARSAQAVLFLFLLGSSAHAQGTISIAIDPSVGPNPFNTNPDSSAPGYLANAITGLVGPYTVPIGTGFQTYSQTNSVTAVQIISTQFQSWNGVANPAISPVQYGSDLFFGLAVNDTTGGTFTANAINYSMSSTLTPAQQTALGLSGDPFLVNNGDFGLLGDAIGAFGPNGPPSNDSLGVSGSASYPPNNGDGNTPLTQFYFPGLFGSIQLQTTGTPAGDQAELSAFLAQLQSVGPFSITATYSLTDSLGNTMSTSETVQVNASAVPEPASCVLVGVGMACLGAYRLRRRATRK